MCGFAELFTGIIEVDSGSAEVEDAGVDDVNGADEEEVPGKLMFSSSESVSLMMVELSSSSSTSAPKIKALSAGTAHTSMYPLRIETKR